MKRLFAAALSAALLLSPALPASAAGTGQVVDWALYTDITAQINGHSLRSYNVNGSTAVVAEDLRGYGFQVLWDGEARTLSVERAMDGAGSPALPVSWPDYTPPALTQPVGTRAQPILSTDIETYVAGQYVSSCNIDGETLIWFSDLAPYGAVTFDEDSRTAQLTLAADPMGYVLEQKELQLKQAGLRYNCDRYPGPNGTALVFTQFGTPHGSACSMIYVAANGTQTQVSTQLPSAGFGPSTYFAPRDIQFDPSGRYLTFITPVIDSELLPDGSLREWGDCLCTLDLDTGLLTWEPLNPGTPA